jgi:hypothetical protein
METVPSLCDGGFTKPYHERRGMVEQDENGPLMTRIGKRRSGRFEFNGF